MPVRTMITADPATPPPSLACPIYDRPLIYLRSYVSGTRRRLEQWDLFRCARQCGKFEYRQRTRTLRRLPWATTS